jgi:hypothetical protein
LMVAVMWKTHPSSNSRAFDACDEKMKKFMVYYMEWIIQVIIFPIRGFTSW